ncbi:hypothetical protein B0H14DRAFT_3124452 [Mycena olivaceomarginata]|nr:hypothetical protein B0H14DRAFT_3124452 [Mycena olivaceomarginata]
MMLSLIGVVLHNGNISAWTIGVYNPGFPGPTSLKLGPERRYDFLLHISDLVEGVTTTRTVQDFRRLVMVPGTRTKIMSLPIESGFIYRGLWYLIYGDLDILVRRWRRKGRRMRWIGQPPSAQGIARCHSFVSTQLNMWFRKKPPSSFGATGPFPLTCTLPLPNPEFISPPDPSTPLPWIEVKARTQGQLNASCDACVQHKSMPVHIKQVEVRLIHSTWPSLNSNRLVGLCPLLNLEHVLTLVAPINGSRYILPIPAIFCKPLNVLTDANSLRTSSYDLTSFLRLSILESVLTPLSNSDDEPLASDQPRPPVNGSVCQYFLHGDAGLAGLAITAAFTFSESVYWAYHFWTALELALDSVKRIIEYTDLPHEPPNLIESQRPLAYRPSSAANTSPVSVLQDVSFAGERVRLVG